MDRLRGGKREGSEGSVGNSQVAERDEEKTTSRDDHGFEPQTKCKQINIQEFIEQKISTE